MALNKKGVVYVLLSITILAIIIILTMSLQRYNFTDKEDFREARIRAMSDFLTSFHTDTERAAYIGGFRSMLALEEFISTSGHFLNNTELTFNEVFYNGTVFGNHYEIMNHSSFSEYMSRVNNIAQKLDIALYTNITNISLYQEDPWHIVVRIDLFVNLTDNRHTADWAYNKTILTKIPIVDLRDPIYSVNTLGKLPNTIKVANFTLFVNDTGNKNDTTNLQILVNESYYINDTKAPSFLMRFQNNLTNSTYGIESLVNLRILGDQGWLIGSNNKSVVDWIYFGNATSTNVCHIQNMVFIPDWFIIDANHISIYQINNTLTYTNC